MGQVPLEVSYEALVVLPAADCWLQVSAMAYGITVYGVDEDFAGAFASAHPSYSAKRVGLRHTTGAPFVKLSDSDVSVSAIDGCLLHWRMVYFLSSACSRAPLMIYNCLYQNAPARVIRPQQCQMVLFLAPAGGPLVRLSKAGGAEKLSTVLFSLPHFILVLYHDTGNMSREY